jgi:hypothetical protein
VIIALAALVPLALLLSEFVLTRQRQAGAHQFGVGGRAAAQGGLDLALGRLQSGDIALSAGQGAAFDLETTPRPVRVRVVRESDAILALDGSVLAPEDLSPAEADRLVVDPVSGAVREYRRIEVYRVEAECPARNPFPAVRLLAAVARLDGRALTLGVRYDRGYFP